MEFFENRRIFYREEIVNFFLAKKAGHRKCKPPLYRGQKPCYNDKEFQKGYDEIWKIMLKNAR